MLGCVAHLLRREAYEDLLLEVVADQGGFELSLADVWVLQQRRNVVQQEQKDMFAHVHVEHELVLLLFARPLAHADLNHRWSGEGKEAGALSRRGLHDRVAASHLVSKCVCLRVCAAIF